MHFFDDIFSWRNFKNFVLKMRPELGTVADLLKSDKYVSHFVLVNQSLANSMIFHPKMADSRPGRISREMPKDISPCSKSSLTLSLNEWRF